MTSRTLGTPTVVIEDSQGVPMEVLCGQRFSVQGFPESAIELLWRRGAGSTLVLENALLTPVSGPILKLGSAAVCHNCLARSKAYKRSDAFIRWAANHRCST